MDAKLQFYAERIYLADQVPEQLAEEVTPVSDSPFAGMLQPG